MNMDSVMAWTFVIVVVGGITAGLIFRYIMACRYLLQLALDNAAFPEKVRTKIENFLGYHN